MEINILSQGFEGESNNSVGKKLIQFISQKNFHTFTGITAFMSQSGIYGLSKYIDKAKHYINKIIIVTGIDQKVTSKKNIFREFLNLVTQT
ncbi:MAG: hypothetical protein IPG78_06745 [Ignavibacteria bacterium]|nr:hypothetical protein [Ignavibacteria bacterium]